MIDVNLFGDITDEHVRIVSDLLCDDVTVNLYSYGGSMALPEAMLYARRAGYPLHTLHIRLFGRAISAAALLTTLANEVTAASNQELGFHSVSWSSAFVSRENVAEYQTDLDDYDETLRSYYRSIGISDESIQLINEAFLRDKVTLIPLRNVLNASKVKLNLC